jgi:hypothetical protein
MKHQIRTLLPDTFLTRRKSKKRFETTYQEAVKVFMDDLKVRNPKKFKKLNKCDFGVDIVPPDMTAGLSLGRYFPKDSLLNARVVIYKAPIQKRAKTAIDQFELILQVLEHII